MPPRVVAGTRRRRVLRLHPAQGLVTLDTATHWSGFGLAAILVLIQLGGLGIMVFATLIGLFSDNLIPFAADPWICLPICAAIILGGLGFPVIMQLRTEWRVPRRWTMNTRLVLVVTTRRRRRCCASSPSISSTASSWPSATTSRRRSSPRRCCCT